MKRISVVIPTYNEAENVAAMHAGLCKLFEGALSRYEHEILFIDNCSADGTQEKLKLICKADENTRAIFNAKNFGQFNSPYYGMLQATGDAVILMAADFQDPLEMLPQFVDAWEDGFPIVCGIKKTSKENKLVYFLRSCYYKLIAKMSSIEQIEHFTGFGLYDKSFIETLRGLNESMPFLRGIVAELGGKRKEIPYEQQLRRAGKTHNNWYSLYDAAMLSFTSYTKVGMRLAIFVGAAFSMVSLLVAFIYLIMKLIYWDRFIAGQAPLMIIVCLMCSILLFFIGLLGEYVLNINSRMMNRPLVVEAERINFPKEGAGNAFNQIAG